MFKNPFKDSVEVRIIGWIFFFVCLVVFVTLGVILREYVIPFLSGAFNKYPFHFFVIFLIGGVIFIVWYVRRSQ